MKKTTKKTASKAKGSKATKNLDVKPAKGGTVRGGGISIPYGKIKFDYRSD